MRNFAFEIINTIFNESYYFYLHKEMEEVDATLEQSYQNNPNYWRVNVNGGAEWTHQLCQQAEEDARYMASRQFYKGGKPVGLAALLSNEELDEIFG